jgi:hypothetical protein
MTMQLRPVHASSAATHSKWTVVSFSDMASKHTLPLTASDGVMMDPQWELTVLTQFLNTSRPSDEFWAGQKQLRSEEA